MRRLVPITLPLLVMLAFTGCEDSPSSSSAPAPEPKAWYSGGTLHGATMSEWSRSPYADRLATSADFVTKMMQIAGETIPPVDEIRPMAEQLERNISAANTDGVADNQGTSNKPLEALMWLRPTSPLSATRVVFVPTAEYYDTKAHELYLKGFWKGTDEQKAQWRAVGNDRPYHYLGSGKTYYLKGRAFGDAVLKVMKNNNDE